MAAPMNNIMADAKSKHCQFHIEIFNNNYKTKTTIGRNEPQHRYVRDVDISHYCASQLTWLSP